MSDASTSQTLEHGVRVHRLDGTDVTLLLLGHADGLPEIAYWGPRLQAIPDLNALAIAMSRPIAQAALDKDYPGATLLPAVGLGQFRATAFAAHRQGQDWTASFVVQEIAARSDGLLIKAHDPVARIGLEMELSLPATGDVLASRVAILNQASEALAVERLAAGVFLLPAEVDEVMAFGGVWAREFAAERFTLPEGQWATENRRGRTSHDRPPLLFIGTQAFGEDHGLVHGIHLGWSGNHRITVEVLEDGRRLAIAEPLFHPGEVILGANERFVTSWAYATLSSRGLGKASRHFHAAARRIAPWPGGAMPPRPVTLNTWEGNYFDHDVDSLRAQATAAARIGVERFVLDDGWFGRRDDDTSSLGDWVVDRRKYPDGLTPLIEHVHGLGMEFGLWVEPEMVNPDSDLFRAHPNWALRLQGRPLDTGRHQLVLDLTRPEVADNLFESLHRLLSDHRIDYLKWDMNRDLLAAGDAAGRPAYHRQVEAFYALIDRLRAAHPGVEIESCASGGGRIDFGVLARTHRFWASDCTDALERVSIQRGFLRLMPPELMGAHVSTQPNHQTGRSHGLDFRAAVALLGHFGIELNPLRLSEEEAATLASWVGLHKRLRPILHAGQVVQAPVRDGRSMVGVVSQDGAAAVYVIVQEGVRRRRLSPPLTFPGLDPGRSYRISAPAPQRPEGLRFGSALAPMWTDGLVLPGALLAGAGLVPPHLLPESALVLTAEAV